MGWQGIFPGDEIGPDQSPESMSRLKNPFWQPYEGVDFAGRSDASSQK